MHFLAAFRTFDRHGVDVRAVKLDIVGAVVGHTFKLLDTADRMSVTAFTLPDVERSTPVTVTADTPVLNVFEPVAEASLADAFGDPVDSIVVSDKVVPYRRHLDEP